MKPTKEVVQAFSNLRVNSDFEVVLEWLREGRKTTRTECESQLDTTKLFRSQGKSLVLKDILDTNDNAPRLLEQYKK